MKYILIILAFTLITCTSESNNQADLIASREAPLGWVTLKLFKPNNFTIGTGRGSKIHTGTYIIKKDTIKFNFKDSIPVNGCEEAIIKNRFINYNKCWGSLKIAHNQLKN